MSLQNHPVSLWGGVPDKMSMMELKLAPGEPVPPGFEDEVRGVTEIQASFDAYHSGPLIGLEYLIELSGYEDEREPQYVCLLCDKRGDPRTVMAHLVSFNHRMTYLQTHFPTAYRAVSPYNTKQYRRNVQNIVTTICEHIEKRFGRMVPQAADRETFERKKQSYMDGVMKDTHPSERLGETFEHLVDKEAILAGPKDAIAEIKKANEEAQLKARQYRKSGSVPGKDEKRDPSPPVVAAPAIKNKSAPKTDRRSLSSISSISSSSLSSPRSRSHSRSRSKTRTTARYTKPKRYPETVTRRSRSRSRSPYRRYYRRSRSYSRSPPRYRRDPYAQPAYYNNTNRMPWQRPEYGARHSSRYSEGRSERRSDNPKNDRYDEYKKQCNMVETEMEKILDQHEKNPEKHPMYSDEWKKFWNRRYKELQAENKDLSKHDFKPEWIDFWNKRMKEMHDAELKAKKDAIRKRLNLPEEPAPISFKILGKRKTGVSGSDSNDKDSNKKAMPAPSTSENEIIIIDDSKDDEIKDHKRSHSPWEMESSRDRERDRDRGVKIDYSREYYKPSKAYREVSRDRERERDYKRIATLSPKYPQKEKEEEINIVAILRLLTALEEKLGSLGPRVIEMLSQALALEKAEANSAETLLDNDVNCVFFETVKEKLKGQLLAGMVDFSAEKTFKNAIQKIASLLHFAAERKREKEKKLKVRNLEPVKIPGIGTIDKSAIAKQIATALIAQGKTDVTQVELEQLINAVVGMAQASQTSGKLVSTASFIQQLSNPTPITTEISSLVQPAMTTSKPDLMTNALQLLQSKSTSDSLINFNAQTTMDGLSDSDLKTLLQNFKDLSTDEQHGLITYLKKLEAREPERVERLRKFVKLGPTNVPGESSGEKAYTSGRISPFSNREAGVNPSLEELDKTSKIVKMPAPPKPKLHIDSDEDDDYSFEDVFRAASKNVKEKQLQEERTKMLDNPKATEKSKDLGLNLNDAKMLIANLMGQLGNSKNNTGINLLGLGGNIGTGNPVLNVGNTANLLTNPNALLTTTTNLLASQNANLNALTSTLLGTTKISGVNPSQPIKPGMNDVAKVQVYNPVPAPASNPNVLTQNYAQYNYPQARQYNPTYDTSYTQQVYQTNQGVPSNATNTINNNNNYANQSAVSTSVTEYGNYGTEQRPNQEYSNTASSYNNQTMAPQQRAPQQPPFNRQQYQGYDPRQNYY